MGPAALDIAGLHKDLGVFTYDPGFGVTAATESRITYIDGDAGVLLYRGYPIEQLAAKSTFMEVAYLLLHGELPTARQLDEFSASIRHHTMINETLLRFFNGFHHNAHPMAMVSAVVASMSAFYHDTMDIHNPRHREIFAHRIIAKIPTIAAAAHKHSLGQPFIYPRNDLGLRQQPAAHDVRRALRALRGGSGRGRRRSTCCSSCTRITSRTRAPRPCAWRAAPAPIRTRRFPPASRRCGVRRMAAPTRRCWRCSSRSAPWTTFRSTWRWRRTSPATSG